MELATTYQRNGSEALWEHYARRPPYSELAYATVRDSCDSADHFPDLAKAQNDLKDVQRPWAVKAILNLVPRGGRLLEIGSGEPLAAARLAALGYDVTICDPFDGSGNGPTEFENVRKHYPAVRFIRSYFTPEVAKLLPTPLDCIFSISVLEHVPQDRLSELYKAIDLALVPGGYSLHAMDHVLEGDGDKWHESQVCLVIQLQQGLSDQVGTNGEFRHRVQDLFQRARHDLDTFYLSPQGHNLWRGATSYEAFPFRKCISVNTIVRRRLAPNRREQRA